MPPSEKMPFHDRATKRRESPTKQSTTCMRERVSRHFRHPKREVYPWLLLLICNSNASKGTLYRAVLTPFCAKTPFLGWPIWLDGRREAYMQQPLKMLQITTFSALCALCLRTGVLLIGRHTYTPLGKFYTPPECQGTPEVCGVTGICVLLRGVL